MGHGISPVNDFTAILPNEQGAARLEIEGVSKRMAIPHSVTSCAFSEGGKRNL